MYRKEIYAPCVQRRRVRQFEKCRCAIDNQRRLDVEHFYSSCHLCYSECLTIFQTLSFCRLKASRD